MRKRIFIYLFAFVTALTLCMGYLAHTATRTIANRQIDEQMRNMAQLIETAIEREHPADLEAFLTGYGLPEDLRATVIALDGTVLADSHSASALEVNHLYRPEVRDALDAGQGSAQRFSATDQQMTRYYAKRLPVGYILRLSIPVQVLSDYTNDVALFIVYAIVAALAISGVVTYLFMRSTIKPLEAWTRWIQGVMRDPKHPPDPPSVRGDAGLSAPLRAVSDQLQQTVLTLSRSNQNMDAILSSMAAGLVAVDDSQRIRFMNAQALELFHIRVSPEGMDLVAATQQPALMRLFQGADMIEIKQNGQTLTARIADMDENDRIIWLEDITSEHSLEQQRRSFASSVSHELKTPLSAIQGAVDGLRVQGANERLLAGIESEVAWLNSLTQDLLTLTRVENMRHDVDVEPLDLQDVLYDVVRSQTLACQAKSIQIEVFAPPISVRASYARLRQLIGNLVSNAVNYNRPGGKVAIEAEAEGCNLTLRIRDSGIGIPPADQPHIFERFYRVDASRSRSSGGTGLGLSIVKHIVRLYEGTISVDSGPDGTTFTVALPIVQEEDA